MRAIIALAFLAAMMTTANAATARCAALERLAPMAHLFPAKQVSAARAWHTKNCKRRR